MELENLSGDQVNHLQSELESWKKKFIDLNRKFHNTQEEVMLR
jgi:hypothetical protein